MKKKMGNLSLQFAKTITAITLFCLLGFTGLQAQEIKGQSVVSSETTTATVTKINQTTREVTIKTEDGQEHSFVASKDVKNLAQIKKGDIITATYTEELAYEVKKHGAPGVKTTEGVVTAKPGAQPGAAMAQQTTVTVTITAIDPTIPTVTFMGPKGNTKTIKVRDPQRLNGVKVGDMVDITYTESLAIKVDPAPKK